VIKSEPFIKSLSTGTPSFWLGLGATSCVGASASFIVFGRVRISAGGHVRMICIRQYGFPTAAP